MSYKKQMPRMNVGKYVGVPIDQLPNSYLRWMIGQKFPKEWLEIAKRKLESSDWNDEYIHVTRHALDMFSKRFISRWATMQIEHGNDGPGIATYVATLAQEAWEKGRNISKYRHQDDGTTKVLDGIKWVFAVNSQFPDYREVVTIMAEE